MGSEEAAREEHEPQQHQHRDLRKQQHGPHSHDADRGEQHGEASAPRSEHAGPRRGHRAREVGEEEHRHQPRRQVERLCREVEAEVVVDRDERSHQQESLRVQRPLARRSQRTTELLQDARAPVRTQSSGDESSGAGGEPEEEHRGHRAHHGDGQDPGPPSGHFADDPRADPAEQSTHCGARDVAAGRGSSVARLDFLTEICESHSGDRPQRHSLHEPQGEQSEDLVAQRRRQTDGGRREHTCGHRRYATDTVRHHRPRDHGQRQAEGGSRHAEGRRRRTDREVG